MDSDWDVTWSDTKVKFKLPALEDDVDKIDKNMYFNQHSNAVDLIFTVLDTGENYITLE